MVQMSASSTLAEVLAARPGSERVLEGFGLDFCCGGSRRLDEACGELGLEPEAVLAALVAQPEEPEPAWVTMGPGPLVDHIEQTHHTYLHTEMARLSALAAKVASVHGDRHPELAGVVEAWEALRADLEPHLAKEERVLFPMIRELAGATSAPRFHCGSIDRPVAVMLAEHDETGRLLALLSERTGGHRPPADGCASFQALYQGFAQLEADTHLHIHKENNLLFPAVVELEASLVAAPAGAESTSANSSARPDSPGGHSVGPRRAEAT